MKVLFDLMAADVAQNTAVFLFFKEPGGAARRAQTVGAEAFHMDHLTDFSLFDHISGENRALHMQALTVIDHVLPAGFPHHGFGAFQLRQGGEGRLVGKVILAGRHHPQPQGAALAGDMRAADQAGVLVLQHLFLAAGGNGLGIGFDKLRHLGGIGIIDIFQGAARLQQGVGHAVDMAVIQMCRGENEFAGGNHGLGLALGGIVHAVGYLHGDSSFVYLV